MIKQLLPILISFLLVIPSIYAQTNEFNPFPQNTDSPYEYNSDNIPDICFFPANKARWDGSKITVKEWPMLTDFQKTMFIAEYEAKMGELLQGIADPTASRAGRRQLPD